MARNLEDDRVPAARVHGWRTAHQVVLAAVLALLGLVVIPGDVVALGALASVPRGSGAEILLAGVWPPADLPWKWVVVVTVAGAVLVQSLLRWRSPGGLRHGPMARLVRLGLSLAVLGYILLVGILAVGQVGVRAECDASPWMQEEPPQQSNGGSADPGADAARKNELADAARQPPWCRTQRADLPLMNAALLPQEPVRLPVWALVLVGLLTYGPRLTHRYWLETLDALHSRDSDDGREPLPFQRDVLDTLAARIDARRREGRTVGLHGVWGSGKSTIVAMLPRALRQRFGPDRYRVVSWSAWTHQEDKDLEYSLFRALAMDPAVVRNAWHVIPWYRLVTWSAWSAVRTTVDVKLMKLEVETPRLQWTRHLCNVLACLEKVGVTPVLVIDELDRAHPEAVQTILSLTQRFLARPNLVTVLPYVPEQIRFKAFNPSQAKIPDLRSTMLAAFWQRRRRLYNHTDDLAPPSVGRDAAPSEPSGEQAPDMGAGDKPSPDGAGRTSSAGREGLHLHGLKSTRQFEMMLSLRAIQLDDDGIGDRLLAQLEQKYYPEPVRIPFPGGADIAALLGPGTTLGELFRDRFGLGEGNEAQRALRALADFARATWADLETKNWGRPIGGRASLRTIIRFAVTALDDVGGVTPPGLEPGGEMRAKMAISLALAVVWREGL